MLFSRGGNFRNKHTIAKKKTWKLPRCANFHVYNITRILSFKQSTRSLQKYTDALKRTKIRNIVVYEINYEVWICCCDGGVIKWAECPSKDLTPYLTRPYPGRGDGLVSCVVLISNGLYSATSFVSKAHCGGVEVVDWTVNRTIWVRFPVYPHRMWALWWQGGKRSLWTSRCRCQGKLGTLKTPSCPWHRVPSSRSKFGNWTTVPSLYSWNIALCDVKPQPTYLSVNRQIHTDKRAPSGCGLSVCCIYFIGQIIKDSNNCHSVYLASATSFDLKNVVCRNLCQSLKKEHRLFHIPVYHRFVLVFSCHYHISNNFDTYMCIWGHCDISFSIAINFIC